MTKNRKLLTGIFALLAATLATVVVSLPRFAAYREWRANAEISLPNGTRMEIQDSWTIPSGKWGQLLRIRSCWHEGTPFKDYHITASLLDETGQKISLYSWYVPLEEQDKDTNIFLWEFSLPESADIPKQLILHLDLKSTKQAGVTIQREIPFPFFDAPTVKGYELTAYPYYHKKTSD